MPKIYTKKGDTGETSLLSGEKVTKDCVNLRVVGEIDELNCILGIAVSKIKEAKNLSRLLDMLVAIQRDLFLAGAEISALQTSSVTSANTVIPAKAGIQSPSVILSATKDPLKLLNNTKIEELEKQIDIWTSDLPELQNFILPGGHPVAADLHLARAICRRVERELVAFGKVRPVRPELYRYFNRLSDWLFTGARWVNFKMKEKETEIK